MGSGAAGRDERRENVRRELTTTSPLSRSRLYVGLSFPCSRSRGGRRARGCQAGTGKNDKRTASQAETRQKQRQPA